MTDFATRLKTLNPAVELSGFPADTGALATEPATANRFLQSAVFPLLVIGLLVYLAIQTLAGN